MKAFLATLLFVVGLFGPPAYAQQSDKVREDLANAMRGNVEAQYNLANRYTYGLGVKRDSVEAGKWLRKAAEQGHVEAQYHLGLWYARGEKRNFAEAVKWYRKAAEQGHNYAQSELANCYAKGIGVKMDQAEAQKWYSKFREQESAADRAAGIRPVPYQPIIPDRKAPSPAVETFVSADSPTTPPVGAPVAPVASSTGVDMVREGGVLKVPVQLNGAITLKFVVDSGASCILIPKDVFLTLIRTETIQERDFLPGKTFVLADGSTVKSDRFILRSIKVGESTFSDVEASVGGVDAQLLLGQSFLSRFDEWKIDNKHGKLILNK